MNEEYEAQYQLAKALERAKWRRKERLQLTKNLVGMLIIVGAIGCLVWLS